MPKVKLREGRGQGGPWGCLFQAAISEEAIQPPPKRLLEQTPPHSCLSLLGAPASSPANPGHALLALEGRVGGRKGARCYGGGWEKELSSMKGREQGRKDARCNEG